MIINNGIRRRRWRWWLTGFSPFRTAAASAILFSARHRPPPSTDVRMRWQTDGCAVILSLKGNGTFRRYYYDSYTNHTPYTYPPHIQNPAPMTERVYTRRTRGSDGRRWFLPLTVLCCKYSYPSILLYNSLRYVVILYIIYIYILRYTRIPRVYFTRDIVTSTTDVYIIQIYIFI